MIITLSDKRDGKHETREANDRVSSCSSNMFGVLSSLGTRVDIFAGQSFFDPERKMLQRIFLKSPFNRCSLTIDDRRIMCLGVRL